MFKKTLLLSFIIANLLFCQPLLIKNVFDKSVSKIIVIDTTISNVTFEKRKISKFFYGDKFKIILLKDYSYKQDAYKNSSIIYWGLFKPNSLVWASITGPLEGARKHYENYSKDASFVGFGKDLFNNKIVLLMSAMNENNMNFNKNAINQSKSYNGFISGRLVEYGLLDDKFQPFKGTMENYNTAADVFYDDKNINVYKYKQSEMTIVSVPDTLYYIYAPINANSVEETAKEGGYRYVINSTYFAGTNTNATHCGRLRVYGKTYVQELIDDKQLEYVAQYNRRQQTMRFFSKSEFVLDKDSLNSIEFQTGPLVVKNGVVVKKAISSSLNGLREAKRTLIGVTDDKHIYFIIVESDVDLIELGQYLLRLDIFKGKKLDVMNLDGGSSTALYSQNNPEVNYNSQAVLPFLLGIK
jgi:exopolysaccharide biosynthesis protein